MSKKQTNINTDTEDKIDLQYTTLVNSIIKENTLPKEAIKKYRRNTWIYVISIISILLLIVIVGIIIWQIIVHVK
ncbi:hypothetical protein ACXYRP_02170 [Mycoplasma sp. 5912]